MSDLKSITTSRSVLQYISTTVSSFAILNYSRSVKRVLVTGYYGIENGHPHQVRGHHQLGAFDCEYIPSLIARCITSGGVSAPLSICHLRLVTRSEIYQ